MSEFSRDKHREFGFPREMEVLHQFLPERVPTSEGGDSAPLHDRPYFLFVGRLEKIKGLEDVIPVFRDYSDADLLIAGEGNYGNAFKAMAQGVERVRFLGRIGQEELQPYYEQALALIVPSVCFETFGIIIVESLRHGTPVIARRIGPFPEIVERSGGGELFADGKELASSMQRIQGEVGYRERLSRRGRASFSEHWSECVAIPHYLEIVRRTAEKKDRPEIVDALAENASEVEELR